ncbi:IQ domain-containing protein F5-like [Orycteropus afer afer]|uniref:IQ domain-containing protein F5-like n=1 Tax=Orycteropus afer afer TaxID=1230840 RepID=A0A8B7AQM4_ORYAF|nr:IQ domain-containing protein F5-like [Orycteropus afer afer]
MWRVRRRYWNMLKAARIIQAYWRCYSCASRGLIKGHYRVVANQNRAKKATDEEKAEAAKKIQAWWRGIQVRQNLLQIALKAWIIQNWWQLMLVRRLEKRQQCALETYTEQEWAAVRLQSWVRMWCIHRCYWHVLNAARMIQSYWRWYICHRGFVRGFFRVTSSMLQTELEIVHGPEACKETQCTPLSIKE